MRDHLTVPGDLEYCPENFASNFDRKINREVAGMLTAGRHFANYPAWEWHGTVWYADGQFHCQVMRYHQHVDTVSAETPEELQQVVSDKWGWE